MVVIELGNKADDAGTFTASHPAGQETVDQTIGA